MEEKQSKLIHEDTLHDPRVSAPPLASFSVVLTRYSVVTPFAPSTDLPAYLAARLPLFRDICFTSIRKQRRLPDLWLIAFHESTRRLVEPVLRLIEKYPWIVPVWQGAAEAKGRPTDDPGDETSTEVLDQFGAAILERMPSDADWLITTRLDNDDALSRDYTTALLQYAAAVVAKGAARDDFWISFPFGLILAGQDCYLTTRTDSQFLSRCVSTQHIRQSPVSAITALQGNHTRVFTRGSAFLPVPVRPMWLQSVHDGNVHNRVRANYLPLAECAPLLKKKFGITREL